MRKTLTTLAVRLGVPVLGGLLVTSVALAAGTFTPFGGAQTNPGTPGSVTLVSNTVDGNPANDYSGVSYQPAGGLTVAGIQNLAADLGPGSQCGGGSPRYAISTASGNIFVYVGAAPNFATCAAGPTGNLLASPDPRVDTSQLPGGTFYDTWAHALQLAGSLPVTDLSFVVDSGWALNGSQTVVVNSLTVNGDTFSVNTPPTSGAPTNKDQCKNGGWQQFTNPSFKNQGDCVSYVATGGRNRGAGR